MWVFSLLTQKGIFMSYKVIAKKFLSATIVRLEISAPLVTRHAQTGQFVVLIADDKGERIPLTIADTDPSKGTITVIFQVVGFSTKKLSALNTGDAVFSVLGPLGHPTPLKKYGSVVCVAGGVGIAEIAPVARALKACGNRVLGLIGARSKNLLILEKELRSICDELAIATDDGSYGTKGFVTDVLKELMSKREPDLIYTVGPIPMMRAVSQMTRSKKIKTIACLNPIMVDATGMCGVCRCEVNGQTRFGCVDGPEFDAHAIDFDKLARRLTFFKEEEETIYKKEVK